LSRSLHKAPYISREVLLHCRVDRNRNNVTFFQRNSTIPFCFCQKTFNIHQGNRFKSYRYARFHQGIKVGQFTLTRRRSKFVSKRPRIVKKRPRIIQSSFSYDLKSKFFTS
jgi:ribosomal protein S19